MSTGAWSCFSCASERQDLSGHATLVDVAVAHFDDVNTSFDARDNVAQPCEQRVRPHLNFFSDCRRERAEQICAHRSKRQASLQRAAVGVWGYWIIGCGTWKCGEVPLGAGRLHPSAGGA